MLFDLANIDIHLFDCDGVLLDSNELKVQAVENALYATGCPKAFVDRATAEFKMNFGRTRIDHFNSFKAFGLPNGFDFSDALVADATNIYSKEVVALYKSCNRIESAAQFISKIAPDKKIFVVSASDQRELREILPFHFPQICISQIYGGPASKIENIELIRKRYEGGPMVLYGDSIQDAKAAMRHKIGFIGLTRYAADASGMSRFCREMDLPIFEGLEQVKL